MYFSYAHTLSSKIILRLSAFIVIHQHSLLINNLIAETLCQHLSYSH